MRNTSSVLSFAQSIRSAAWRSWPLRRFEASLVPEENQVDDLLHRVRHRVPRKRNREDCHLERQRHPRAAWPAAGVDRSRASRRRSACRRSRQRSTSCPWASAISRATGATGTGPRGTRASACTSARSAGPTGRRSRTRRSTSRTGSSPPSWATSRWRPSTCRTAGRTFPRRCASSSRCTRWRRSITQPAGPLVMCGDLNVARTERDVHPKERKPAAIGQLPEERALLERIIGGGTRGRRSCAGAGR